MSDNKIKYGVKNVHYALATIADDHTATYDAPKALPGAVNLSLDPEGDTTPFYADNIVYYLGVSNNGYSGDLEMAYLTDDFRKDCLGELEDVKGVSIEAEGIEPPHFALLFQFEGDVKATRHVMYNCTASRPAVTGETKGESVEPQTETTTITATTIYDPVLDKEIVKAKTGPNSDSDTYDNWFKNVYKTTGLPDVSE